MARSDDVLDAIIEQAMRTASRGLQNLQALYQDEPIVQRASQLLDPALSRYRQMRRIASDLEARHHSAAWLFYRQGSFMADYSDDFTYHGTIVQFYPTYQALSPLQLRGYFGWRTRLRAGDLQVESRAYAFLYVYELLNQIGVEDPQQGFAMLREFWQRYRERDTCLDSYMQRWLRDYVVYYGLDRALLDDFYDTAYEQALLVLRSPDEARDQVLFDALCGLSGYRLENSRLYRLQPQLLQGAVCAVWRQMSAFFVSHRKNSLCEKLFGRTVAVPMQMFDAAVFYDRRRYADYTYTVNPLHVYRCTNGVWSCERLMRRPEKSTELGGILKMIDCRLREKLSITPPLQPGEISRQAAKQIDRALEAYLAAEAREKAQRQAAAVRMEIDLSRLADIRSDAAETCGRLTAEGFLGAEVTGEGPAAPAFAAAETAGLADRSADSPDTGAENLSFADIPDQTAAPAARTEKTAPAADVPAPAVDTAASDPALSANTTDVPPAAPAEVAEPSAQTTDASPAVTPAEPPAESPADPLSAPQRALLRRLLYGEAAVLPPGQTVALLCDGINEALFDRFADTVVLFDGEAPCLAEDYIPALQALYPR